MVRAQLSADRLCSGAARPERGATCAPEQTVARRPRHTRGSADWSAARERAGRGGLTEGARRSTAAGGEDRRARWLQPGPLALSVPARAHSSLGPRTEAYDARGKKGVPWARWCAVPVRTRPEQPGLCSAGTALQRGSGRGHVPRPVVRVAARRVCKRTSKRAWVFCFEDTGERARKHELVFSRRSTAEWECCCMSSGLSDRRRELRTGGQMWLSTVEARGSLALCLV